MAPLQPIFKKAYWSLVGFGALYGLLLLALTNQTVQRHALYVHSLPVPQHGLNSPESIGFAKNQVTPFLLNTTDGEELYGWHILPIGLYAKHEDELLAQSIEMNFKTSKAHQLLIEDPEARVVINFHGNAGNVAQGYRPQTYRSLTSSNSKIHVITVDYRGFGRSTGVPSEAGLIMDGVALVNYVLSLGVPPERIVLLGQSLGTQVASAVALHFADYAASMRLLPSADSDINLPEDPSSVLAPSPEPITFGSVVLVASFPALNKLLKVYRLGGLIPILSPLRVYPYIQSLVLRFVHENWNTSSRLAALVDSAAKNSRALNVQIIHARDDRDIHYTMGQENFLACVSALEYVSSGGVETKSQGDWGDHVIKKQAVYKDVRVEWELFMSGGHNRIVADVPIALAVMRGLNI